MTTEPTDESAPGTTSSEPHSTEPGSTDPSDTPPSPSPRPRRLTRSRTDEWFGGVAGGLAEYFDTDPTLIRVAFVLAALLTSGFAILGYIAAWIIVPEAPSDADHAASDSGTHTTRRGGSGAMFWGGILVIGGAFLLLAQLDVDMPIPSLRVGLAIALIAIGLLMLVEARRGFHGGLIALALILTLMLGTSSVGRMNFAVDGAFGEQRHQVERAADLRSEYSHAFGSLTLDLRDAEFGPGTTEVQVSVAFGEATVLLPPDLPYRIDGSSVFGNIEAPGVNAGGIASSRTYTSPGYADAENRLEIHISAAFGTGRVR